MGYHPDTCDCPICANDKREIANTVKIRKITKDRLIFCHNNFDLIDTMVHEGTKYETLVTDDSVLTEEIKLLKMAVERFEKNTKVFIKISSI